MCSRQALIGATIVALVFLDAHSLALAVPISVSNEYHFRQTTSANTAGIPGGDVLRFGAFTVIPNSAAGTSGTASQGAITGHVLFNSPGEILAPNEFTSQVPYDPLLTGAWQLRFTNGPNAMITTTPTVGPLTDKAPFAASVLIGGAGITPTVSWTAPTTAGFVADATRITIRDLTQDIDPGPGFLGLAIFSRDLGPGVTSLTVPSGVLQLGTRYSLEVSLIETRDHLAPTGGNANILRRSRGFFDFTVLSAGAPAAYLPTVNPITGVYEFEILGIVAGQTIFIDPLVAVGYDYAIGPGDPNFASVLLPDVGDGLFELYLFDGSSFVFSDTLTSGSVHDFGPGGVQQFRILGIEPEAGLDPLDGTAFVTGLTFTADGDFTGTMTPIIQQVQVPTPAALLLVGSGVVAMIAFARRRRH